MCCKVESGQMENSGKWPCGVCREGVGANSIVCTVCKQWVHRRCCGLSGSLSGVVGFKCSRCIEGTGREKTMKAVEVDHVGKLECVSKFCYLGDMIGSGGGAEETSRARVRCAWGKFRELAPILTSRGASLKVKEKVFNVL